MKAQRPRRRSGQGRSRRRRWRAAPALTRAQPWTTANDYSLSGLSGATTQIGIAAMFGLGSMVANTTTSVALTFAACRRLARLPKSQHARESAMGERLGLLFSD